MQKNIWFCDTHEKAILDEHFNTNFVNGYLQIDIFISRYYIFICKLIYNK